jgi:integrase
MQRSFRLVLSPKRSRTNLRRMQRSSNLVLSPNLLNRMQRSFRLVLSPRRSHTNLRRMQRSCRFVVSPRRSHTFRHSFRSSSAKHLARRFIFGFSHSRLMQILTRTFFAA